ncbi:hypothetical protein H6P81_002561 [Aristolochia fimbriata]|uniref:Uncharacterized protein n=1 Tax=Aristolochia fimbriata TaxID=158543 RepID=A0AAV7FAT3_ARIFI|nr:hypothetical protein H6P81_002561 [Aristolochia fimbriata]
MPQPPQRPSLPILPVDAAPTGTFLDVDVRVPGGVTFGVLLRALGSGLSWSSLRRAAQMLLPGHFQLWGLQLRHRIFSSFPLWPNFLSEAQAGGPLMAASSLNSSVAEKLGLPFLNPYSESGGNNYRHGVNFAAGRATVRPQRSDNPPPPQCPSWAVHGV